MNLETLITVGYYVSSIGYLVATIMMAIAVSRFGKSTLGSILTYILTGTAVFFIITIFQKLGAGFFGIADESVDIWWHLMFYIAFISYFLGLKALIGLGEGNGTESGKGLSKVWMIVSAILLIIIFVIPGSVDTSVISYDSSSLGQLGLHHFLAFIIAGIVTSYLVSAKNELGQIGKSIANPMIIATGALALQHFWELLTESWAVFEISGENIEGVEKIFLTISAVAVIFAAKRLISFTKGQ